MRNELDISLEKRYVKEEAFKEGREEGLAEGSNTRSEEIARKMQSEGLDAELILRITGVKISSPDSHSH